MAHEHSSSRDDDSDNAIRRCGASSPTLKPSPSIRHMTPPPIAFHVTGFGVFNGIPDNPTTHIVNELPGALMARGFHNSRDGSGGSSDRGSSFSGQPRSGAFIAKDGSFEIYPRGVLHVSADEGGRQVRQMHSRLSSRRHRHHRGSHDMTSSGGVTDASVMDEEAEYPAERPLYQDTGRRFVDENSGCDGAADDISGNCNKSDGGASSIPADAGISAGSDPGGPVYPDEDDDERKGQTSVFVHCGVDGDGRTFKLESRAYNEATFRVPDEKGYQPTHIAIDESNADIAHVRNTTLPIAETLSKLEEMGWGPAHVMESTCAGRFVCNYVYYTSLGLCEAEASSAVPAAEDPCPPTSSPPPKSRCQRHCLFLHVPPFSVIAKDEQLSFVVDCLTAIAECLGASAGTSDAKKDSSIDEGPAVAVGARGGNAGSDTTDVFAPAPADTVAPSSHGNIRPNEQRGPPSNLPSATVPSRSNAGSFRSYAATAIRRSNSMPYYGAGRSSNLLVGERDGSTSYLSSVIWDEDDLRPVATKAEARLPMPSSRAHGDSHYARFRSAARGPATHHSADYSSSSVDVGGGMLRGYSGRQDQEDNVSEYYDEDDEETQAEVTRRRLIEAGFEALDVDAGMATTGSDDMETNMQFLLDITPLLPRGSPAVGDIDALREFLSGTSDHGPGGRRRNIGAGGAAPRPSPVGSRVRTRSAGSAGGMAGVTPKWVGEIRPKVSPNGVNGTASPGVSSEASTPRSGGGLLARFRRHKKNSSSTGSASSTLSTASLSSSTTSTSLKTRRPAAAAATKEQRSALATPAIARSYSMGTTSTTTVSTVDAAASGGRGGDASPEYCRRTTGNSTRSLSPPPDNLRCTVGVPTKIDPSAGWGDTSPLAATTLRLVLLVRVDLGMGAGAIAAHCCRAVLAATRKVEGSGAADELAVWRNAGEATVVLAARDSRALGAVLEVRAHTLVGLDTRPACTGRTKCTSSVLVVAVQRRVPPVHIYLCTCRYHA